MTARGRETGPDGWGSEDLEAVPACPVCGSGERAILYEGLEDHQFGTPGRWTFKRCLGCRSAYLDPRPAAGAIARAYERYYTHEEPYDPGRLGSMLSLLKHALRNGYLNSALGYGLEPAVPLARWILAPFPIRRRLARRLVADLSPPRNGGRLLDVGCGNGRVLVAMRWAGWQVEGIEPDERAAVEARRLGLTVHSGTLGDVDLAASSFDAITIEHVVEHLPVPVETLERCRRLLRPGGRLWLVTPNLDSPGHREYVCDWRGLEPPRHFVLLTPSALRHALESAGFEMEFVPPAPVGWMLASSEELRARRTGRPASRARKLEIGLRAKVRDLRAPRSPTAGEELVVLARPKAR